MGESRFACVSESICVESEIELGVSDRSGFGPVQSALRTRPPVQYGLEGLGTLESASLCPATKWNHPVGAREAGARE